MKKYILILFLSYAKIALSQCASPNGQFFNYNGGFPTYATANTNGWCINGLTAGQTYCYQYTYPSVGNIELALRFTGCGTCANSYLSMTPANGGGCANGAVSCGSRLYNQSCTLIDDNLRVGGTCTVPSQTYTFCFTVPAGCGGMSVCPMIRCSSGPCTPALPVTWVKAEAKRIKGQTLVLWSVATQVNNDYFEVEHSLDGKLFSPVDKVYGEANTTITKEYHSIHNSNIFGVNYYRVKQVDFDGNSSYSEICLVTIDEEIKEKTIIHNMSGAQVNEMTSSGIYIVSTINESGNIKTSKIFKP